MIGSEEHQQLNLEVAREAVALLKNNGSLPFNAAGAKRIAVVGPLADDAQTQLGDWAGSSGQINWMPDGHPREMITTVLDGFRQLSPEGCEVVYSRGANIVDLVPDPEGEFYPDGQPRPKIGVSAKLDRALLDEAVENARQSDLIVAVVGDVIQAIGEGCSTATLELLGGQNALIDALSNVARETGKPFVVVLVSSKPQVLPASVIGTNGVIVDETPAEGTSALLWAPSPGMKGGQAIAEIILGETEPERTTADHFPASRRPAAGLLQPDSRPARQPLRRPHAESGIRIRRRPELHHVRIRRADRHQCSGIRHVRRNRHRACRNHPHQYGRSQGHGSSAALHRRHR